MNCERIERKKRGEFEETFHNFEDIDFEESSPVNFTRNLRIYSTMSFNFCQKFSDFYIISP